MASNTRVLADIIQDHLECPICSERLKQPKLLECSHSFCLKCLQQLRQKSPSTCTTKLLCPMCRKNTLLNENGIDGLKTDFKSISLMGAFEKQEIQLKKQHEKQVHSMPSQEFVSKCSKHTDKDLVLYCTGCIKLICPTCVVRDHQSHNLMELHKASDKSKQYAMELLAEVSQCIKTFNNAIQEIDMSRKTLDSMFAATKEKISKKAHQQIAKEVGKIRGEEEKLMQEAEQIYKDRVNKMETARATKSKEMNKAEHKQDEIYQLIDQGFKIVHHIEKLLQDLKEYRKMKSTKVPDELTSIYIDFKEGQNSVGRLVLTYKWTLKAEIKTDYHSWDVTAFSNSDIVVSDRDSVRMFKISTESNPQSTVIPQTLSIKRLIRPHRVTLNKNDELIVIDTKAIKIFNRNYQLLNEFKPGSEPTCIAVDDTNLIAVGYHSKAKISLHKPHGSFIRTLPAPGIGGYLTTYKQRLIYTNYKDKKLLSVDYNGDMVLSLNIPQSRRPHGVCCDKDGNIYIYVCVLTGPFPSPDEVHHYSPDGKYIGCIIKGCVQPHGMTLTPAGDLVMAAGNSVQIYHHE